jgi:hypothetical protein
MKTCCLSVRRPIEMTESSTPCEVGEANKLIRIQNYNVWKIKIESILRRERLWGLVETNRTIIVFLTTIEGVSYPNEEELQSEKQRARSGLILSVADNLLGIVAGKQIQPILGTYFAACTTRRTSSIFYS